MVSGGRNKVRCSCFLLLLCGFKYFSMGLKFASNNHSLNSVSVLCENPCLHFSIKHCVLCIQLMWEGLGLGGGEAVGDWNR